MDEQELQAEIRRLKDKLATAEFSVGCCKSGNMGLQMLLDEASGECSESLDEAVALASEVFQELHAKDAALLEILSIIKPRLPNSWNWGDEPSKHTLDIDGREVNTIRDAWDLYRASHGEPEP